VLNPQVALFFLAFLKRTTGAMFIGLGVKLAFSR
jgi:threonine/homoserine/homoserine lactone efflux protein